MIDTPDLSPVGEIVRRNDRDRFTTAMFAPPALREDLFALYALNVELAKIRDMVSEPMLGRIRLQWWRESLDGIGTDQERRHEVVQPLAALLANGRVTKDELMALIDAREADLEDVQPENLPALEAYVGATAGKLSELAAVTLGTEGDQGREAAYAAGMAYGLVGVLRALVHHARTNRLLLPKQEADSHGMKKSDALEMRGSDGLSKLAAALADRAREHLTSARAHRRAVAKPALAAMLPATVAGQYLGYLQKAGNNPFDAKFGLARPGVAGLMARAFIGRF